MKKNLKFFVSLVFLIFVCFSFCSCASFNSSAHTDMIINKDGSGDRIINIEINKVDLKLKNAAYIDELINLNCPQEFEFSKKDDLYKTIYSFDLKFKSIEEYKSKIKKLINDNPCVEFSMPDNIFTNGVELKENFDSKDLLDWCYSDSQLSDFLLKNNIWKNQSTTVHFKGDKYNSSKKLNITNINYMPIDRIDIISNLNSENEIQRTINFYIPSETVEKLGQDLNIYLKSLETENCSDNISYTQNGEVFSIKFSTNNYSDLSNIMNKILSSKACKAKIYEENTSLFETENVLDENLDFSAFASNSNGDIFINYELNSTNKTIVSAKKYQDNNWENLDYCLDQNILKLSQDMKNLKINVSMGEKDEISDIGIETKINDINKLQRVIKLKFSNDETLEKAKDYYENLKLENANVYKKDNECIIDLTGTTEQINVSQKKILGKDNNISIYKENRMNINNIIKFDDHIDIADFLNSIRYNSKVNYDLNSNLKIQTLLQKNDDSSKSTNTKINSYNINTIIEESGVTSIETTSYILNQTFTINLIIIIFIIFSVVILFICFFVRKYLYSKAPEDILAQKEKFYMSEYLCPNCKMPTIIGMNYCVNCGVRLKKLNKKDSHKK